MSKRREFTRTTKLAIWERAKGRCQHVSEDGSRCPVKFFPGDARHFDHIIACEHGGGNDVSNGQLLCVIHHRPKTRADMAITVRGRKARAQHIGANKPKRPMAGSRDSKWKRKVDGTVVLR